MKQEKMDSEMEQFEDFLRGVKKPAISVKNKRLLKARVMEGVSDSFLISLKSFVSKTVLSFERKAILKERIMDMIESHSQKRFFWTNFFVFQKRFVSAMLLFMMVFGLFSFVNLNVGVVHAETFTTLESFSGDISIERDGENVGVERGMRIYENDKIFTGENGFASITFFDDSVSRLAGGTEVLIDKLVRPDNSYAKSYVELNLEKGEMWTRVVNLVEKDSAFVVAKNDTKAVAKRAAFNMSVREDSVEVEVFNHEVDFESPITVETVVSGRKVNFSNEKVVVSDLNDSDKDVTWVKDNLSNDKVYLTEVEQRLLAAKMESVGVDVGDDFDYGASLTDEAVVFLTLNDVKKQKKELDIAEKAFVSAEVKLNDPNATKEEINEAKGVIVSFKDSIKDFDKVVDEVRTTDVEYADELKGYVEEKIANQKKNLSLALPDDPSYFAKKVVEDVEIEVIDDEKELIEKKAEHGVSKIAEAEDIIERDGDVGLAKAVLEEGKGEVEDVAGLVDNLDKTEEKEIVRELEQKVEMNLYRADKVGQKVAGVEGEIVPDDSDSLKNVDGSDGSAEEGEQNVERSERSDQIDTTDLELEEKYGVRVEDDRPLDPLLY